MAGCRNLHGLDLRLRPGNRKRCGVGCCSVVFTGSVLDDLICHGCFDRFRYARIIPIRPLRGAMQMILAPCIDRLRPEMLLRNQIDAEMIRLERHYTILFRRMHVSKGTVRFNTVYRHRLFGFRHRNVHIHRRFRLFFFTVFFQVDIKCLCDFAAERVRIGGFIRHARDAQRCCIRHGRVICVGNRYSGVRITQTDDRHFVCRRMRTDGCRNRGMAALVCGHQPGLVNGCNGFIARRPHGRLFVRCITRLIDDLKLFRAIETHGAGRRIQHDPLDRRVDRDRAGKDKVSDKDLDLGRSCTDARHRSVIRCRGNGSIHTYISCLFRRIGRRQDEFDLLRFALIQRQFRNGQFRVLQRLQYGQ